MFHAIPTSLFIPAGSASIQGNRSHQLAVWRYGTVTQCVRYIGRLRHCSNGALFNSIASRRLISVLPKSRSCLTLFGRQFHVTGNIMRSSPITLSRPRRMSKTQCFKVDAPLIVEQFHWPRYEFFFAGLTGSTFWIERV
jgi:hypothetical protein